MDISRFLNSRDVADHLREIGYEPSMPEASLIVYGMWLAIPTPFRRGDVVRSARDAGDGPFVLDHLPTWGSSGLLAEP